ncbi:MAG: hypothetical protein H7123_01810 [Thermoleophilia bacterium]|nr:hypothetical protein [Thermoleophilia bacterium]
MLALIILAAVLLTFWVWALVNRDAAAAFMQPFLHVPLIAAGMIALMAVGALVLR